MLCGVLGGTRTPNLLVRSQTLYPLSYENSAECLSHSRKGVKVIQAACKKAILVSETPSQPDLSEESRRRQRRWLRVLLLASLAILLVAVGAELPEQGEPSRRPQQAVTVGPDDQFISPGERAGFLRLGLHIATVEQRLGRGKAKPTQTAVLYRFDQAGLTCGVQRGQVAYVLVTNPLLHTPAGIAVGSDADLVVRELGDDYEYEPLEKPPATPNGPKPNAFTLHYWKEGIHINMNGDKVESILIMAPTAN